MKYFLLNIIAWGLMVMLSLPTFIIGLILSIMHGKEVIERYLLNVAIGIDQFGATLLGWNPDTTISGNIGYRIRKGKATRFEKALCYILNMLDVQHCNKSIEHDENYERSIL